mgnify:CR=1 FL=1
MGRHWGSGYSEVQEVLSNSYSKLSMYKWTRLFRHVLLLSNHLEKRTHGTYIR